MTPKGPIQAVTQKAIEATNSIGCAEFWLNRYQTFVIGLLALAAGIFAGWATFGQMKEARRQSALVVRATIEKRIADLSAERHSECIGKIGSFTTIMETFETNLNRQDRSALYEDLSKVVEEIYAFTMTNPGARRVRQERTQLMGTLRIAQDALNDLSQAEKFLKKPS